MQQLSLIDRSMQDIFSHYGKWLRNGLVACGIGSIVVLGGCELGAPPIEEVKDAEPKPSLVDQYKQANKDSRDPGLAANPKALGESLLTNPEGAMQKGGEDLESQ